MKDVKGNDKGVRRPVFGRLGEEVLAEKESDRLVGFLDRFLEDFVEGVG